MILNYLGLGPDLSFHMNFNIGNPFTNKVSIANYLRQGCGSTLFFADPDLDPPNSKYMDLDPDPDLDPAPLKIYQNDNILFKKCGLG